MSVLPAGSRGQAARFARLFLLTLAPQLIALYGHHAGRSVIIAAVVGAAEVAWRAVAPPPEAVIGPGVPLL